MWADVDANGVQDSNEPGVEGVHVIVKDADGNEIGRTATNKDGRYAFEVEPGHYTLEFDYSQAVIPEGAHITGFTQANAGDNREVDSNVIDGAIVVDVNAEDLSLDAGLVFEVDKAAAPAPENPAKPAGEEGPNKGVVTGDAHESTNIVATAIGLGMTLVGAAGAAMGIRRKK